MGILGDSILVAPVFSKSEDVNFNLPAGSWTSWFKEEVKKACGYGKAQIQNLFIGVEVTVFSLAGTGSGSTLLVDSADVDVGEVTVVKETVNGVRKYMFTVPQALSTLPSTAIFFKYIVRK
ncbi:hypothetical protein RUND412_010199 [Rhizina undulata]